MRLTIFRIMLVFISVGVALVFLEIAFRLAGRPRVQTSGFKSNDIAVVKGVPLSELNQLNYRGQKIAYADDDAVVVLLGDSQVEARACAYEWMPERRLEHHLSASGNKTKVFTLGASSYGQDQELLALREYFKTYRANLVIVWLTPENDVWNNTFPTISGDNGWAKPTFWLENGQLRGPSEPEIGQPVSGTPRLKIFALWRRFFAPRRDAEWEKKYLPAPYAPLDHYDGPVNRDWQRYWETNYGDFRSDNLKIEKGNSAMLFTPRSRRVEYGLDLTRRLLEEIQRLAAAHGSRFLIFEALSPDDKSFAGDEIYSLNGNYYKTSGRQFRENKEQIVAGLNYRQIPVKLEPHRVGPEDSHLNEHAVDQLMKDLAAAVSENIRR